MFGGNKFGFGAQGTTGGFGSTTSTTGGFGATPSSSTSGFGGFGAIGATTTAGNKPSLFGSAANTSTAGGMSNPFGGTSTGFGTAGGGSGLFGTGTAGSGTAGAGSSIFGKSAQPAQASSSLFGSPSTGTAFGQATSFGTATPSFGGGAGLFGASANKPGTTGFGALGSQAFSTPGAAAMVGTTKKFEPTSGGPDTMAKGGGTLSVQTKYQSITAMPDYSGKCFDELRAEDYGAGRKTGTAGSGGSGLFGQSAATSTGFGSVTGSAPAFGQTSTNTTGFGGSAGSSLFSSAASTNPFGGAQAKPTGTSTVFGQTGVGQASTGSTGFGTSLFGQQSTGSSMFGQQANKTGSLFGSTATTQQSSLFGPTSSAATPFGSTATSGFQTDNKPGGFSFGNTGQTSTAGFGGFGTNTSTAGGGLFGAKPQTTGAGLSLGGFGNPAASTGGFSFNTGSSLGGAATQLGGTTALGSTSLGSTTKAPSLFGFSGPTNTAGSNMFQLNTGTSLATAPTLGSSLTGQPSAQDGALQLKIQQQALALAASPYGDSDLFKNLKDRPRSDMKPTDAAAHKAVLDSAKIQVHSQPVKLKTYPIRPRSAGAGQARRGDGRAPRVPDLFDGLDDEASDAFLNDSFVPRRSVKRLILSEISQSEVSSQGADQSDARSGSMFSQSTPRPVQTCLRDPPAPATATPKSVKGMTTVLPSPTLDLGSPARGPGNEAEVSLDDSLHMYKQVDRAAPNPACPPTQQTTSTASQSPQQPATSCEGAGQSQEALHGPNESSLSLEADNIQDDEVSSSPHPAGIVLRRPGYYTLPDLEELTPDSQGRCIVDGLTIGRYGYGNVFFPGQTELTDLNIDEIVSIARKEVTIYPEDDESKPPVGQGLNKKATVTLDFVWPRDKTTHDPVKSPERLMLMRYAARVETATARMGARFIEYRPETGSWVFEVDHFSRYQLVDDGESESSSEQQTKLPAPLQTKDLNVPPTQAASSAKGSLLAEDTRDMTQLDSHQSEPMYDGRDAPSSSVGQSKMAYPEEVHNVDMGADDRPTGAEQHTEENPLLFGHLQQYADWTPAASIPQHMKVDVTAIQRLKASFLLDDDEEETARTSTDVLKRFPSAVATPTIEANQWNTSKRSHVQPSSPAPGRLDLSVGQSTLGVAPPVALRPSLARVSAPEYPLLSRRGGVHPVESSDPMCTVALLAPRHPPTQSMRADMQADMQAPLVDSSLMHGRGCRVGWGPHLTMVKLQCTPAPSPVGSGDFSTPLSTVPNQGTSYICILQSVYSLVPSAKTVLDDSPSHLVDTLKLSYDCCDKEEDGDPVSMGYRLSPLLGPRLLEGLSEGSAMEGGITPMERSEGVVWGLCQALWGDQSKLVLKYKTDSVDSPSQYIKDLCRAQAFSAWLQSASRHAPEVKGADLPEVIFGHMTCRDMLEASQEALQGRDLRLSLLLSQESSVLVKDFLLQQLNGWKSTKSDQYIDVHRLKILCLLAGVLHWEGSAQWVSACESLQWKQTMGLLSWFVCPANASISHILSYYQQELQDGHVALPLPPYLESSQAEQENMDVCYLLLKFYCREAVSMETLLSPQSATCDPLDYHLSWHLWNVLVSVGAVPAQSEALSDSSYHHLCVSYASQLEDTRLWPWALYVLTHLPADQRRAPVMSVLLRNLGKGDNSEIEQLCGLRDLDHFITDGLGVPLSWVHEAKALLLSQDSRRWAEECYEHLLGSNQYGKAHGLLINEIAPYMVINGELDRLRKLLTALSESIPHSPSSIVSDWSTGALIYIQFVGLYETCRVFEMGKASAEDQEKVLADVVSLSSTLGSLYCPTANHRLCRSEMAKHVSGLLKALLCIQEGARVPGYESMISSRLSGPLLSRLPLPEDHALSELAELARAYSMEFSL